MESSGEIERIGRELNATALTIQKMMGDLSAAMREQQHSQEELKELRGTIQIMNRLLREESGSGIPPLATRMALLENRVTTFEASRQMGRDWWYKVLQNVVAVAIIGLVTSLLAIYVASRTWGPAPLTVPPRATAPTP